MLTIYPRGQQDKKIAARHARCRYARSRFRYFQSFDLGDIVGMVPTFAGRNLIPLRLVHPQIVELGRQALLASKDPETTGGIDTP
jgi:hypothetical protein